MYRFIMAGRGEDAYQQAMWDVARIRHRIILDANWPDDTHPEKSPRAPKLGRSRPQNLGHESRVKDSKSNHLESLISGQRGRMKGGRAL
jgi:hypothetical protein